MTEEKSNTKKWFNFLDPNNLKDKLIFSSLYIATFESFKDYIVEEVKFFFNTGFSSNEFTFSDNYKTAVLLKDKSVLKATIFWLKDCGAIEEKDIVTQPGAPTFYVIHLQGEVAICVRPTCAVPVRLNIKSLKRIGRVSGSSIARFYELKSACEKIMKEQAAKVET